MDTTQTDTSPSRVQIWSMFDRIAHRYDFVNRILSMRQDVIWRKRVASYLRGRGITSLLDLATGTGDQLLTIINSVPELKSATGMDLSEKMLDVGRRKVAARNLNDKVILKTGDATQIPAPDNTYDALTISFGIRNVTDVLQSLRDMHRVLKPGGRAIILEFSLPSHPIIRQSYLFYLRNILPKFGTLLSGDGYAYHYLNQTIETFPYGQDFCNLMTQAGFTAVQCVPQTFGIATIYIGDKSS